MEDEGTGDGVTGAKVDDSALLRMAARLSNR